MIYGLYLSIYMVGSLLNVSFFLLSSTIQNIQGIIQCTQYLILGTVKSDGSLEIFTICGRLGNFSKIRNRRGSFSFVSALASLCFSCGEKPKDSLETNVLFCDSTERLMGPHCVFTHSPQNIWWTVQN